MGPHSQNSDLSDGIYRMKHRSIVALSAIAALLVASWRRFTRKTMSRNSSISPGKISSR